LVSLALALTCTTGAEAVTHGLRFDDVPAGHQYPVDADVALGVRLAQSTETVALFETASPPNALWRIPACDTECDNGSYSLSVSFAEGASEVTLQSGAEYPSADWGCFPEGSFCEAFARLMGFNATGSLVADSGDVRIFTFDDPSPISITTPVGISDPQRRIRWATLVVGRGTVSHDFGDARRVILDDLTVTMPAAPTIDITVPPEDATYEVGQTVVASYECADEPGGSGVTSCAGPVASGESLDTATEGTHQFTVVATDAVGNQSSATRTFRVVGRDSDRDDVPDSRDNCVDVRNPDQADSDRDGVGDACDVPGTADRDRDGVLDARDNCPDAANAAQEDRDKDEIGDVCDVVLAPGDLPVIAGSVARVQQVAGSVFVKLPRRATRAGGFAAQAPISGFVPLKGVATIPVGSVVDARKGTVALTTAADLRRTRARRTQRGRFSAALFRIRQARRLAKLRRVSKRARRARSPATDLVLTTPPGLGQACAATRSPTVGPAKGVVRALTGSGKGIFRAVGGASTTTVTSGTWIVQDRCNGTLTEVGRGRATVFVPRLERSVNVTPGRAYLARARLFGARRSSRP
jgi:hypothetical protein